MNPRISDAEWRVMKVVWRKPHCGAQDIIGALANSTDWSPGTIKTLLNRLVRKKALGFAREGKAYRYFARVTEVECRAAEAETFLDRVFNGALTPMVAHFVNNRRLSRKEIEELEQLLRQGKKSGE
jgi:BlaI family penicillinase repressor